MAFVVAALSFGSVSALTWAFAPALFPWLVGLFVAGLVFGKQDAK